MNSSVSILRKGLFLVAIPVTAQMLFLGILLIVRADQQDAQRWAIHTKEVLAKSEACHRSVIEALTHMRGFVLTSEAGFEKMYWSVRDQVPGRYAELLAEVEDSEPQKQNVEAMKRQSQDFLRWMDENMKLMKQGKQAEVVLRIQRMEGTNSLQHLRELTDVFLAKEEQLDRERTEALAQAMRLQNWALLGGVVLALGTAATLLILFSRGIARRLNTLVENTKRLAEGKELVGPLQGDDELSRLDAMFHQMAETIRQKDRENEMFVYSVSHDLRSPLVNLQGFSEELNTVVKELRGLLGDEALPKLLRERSMKLIDRDAGEAIQFIQTAVTRLAGIIDALLRLSRIGRVEYRWQNVDVNAVVHRVVKSLHASSSRRGAEITVEPLPSCWGDPTAIDQIFGNLLANAVNYLDPARPGRITVSHRTAETAPGMQVYTVTDNGLGIPEAFQGKVFVAFQRLHPEVGPGEGIGLALVRRIVERHAGRIWLESTAGQGSTFFVALPSAKTPLSEPKDTVGQVVPDPAKSQAQPDLQTGGKTR